MNDKENIPQLNDILYTMRLRNGDEILFTLVSEEEEGLIIESPIKITVVAGRDEGENFSELVTQKWLLFASDNTLFVPYIDIIVYSKMRESAYKIYLSAVKRYADEEQIIEDEEAHEVSSFISPAPDVIQ